MDGLGSIVLVLILTNESQLDAVRACTAQNSCLVYIAYSFAFVWLCLCCSRNSLADSPKSPLSLMILKLPMQLWHS